MNKNEVTVELNFLTTGKKTDLRVPLDITVNELITALANAEGLGINMNADDLSKCCLKTENPIALLKGNKLLSACGLRNGTIINIM